MKTPLYRKIYTELWNRIHTGTYPRGTMLPSEPRLSDEFGASIITIRRAIHELVLDGFVDSRQGIGNFVKKAGQGGIIVGMSSFTSDVAEGRLRLVRTLMADNMVQASEAVAEKLNVQPGSLVRRLLRLDMEGGVALSIDEAFIPPALATSITPDIAGSPLFMHLWQESAGMAFIRTTYDIWTEMAGDKDRKWLQIRQDIPMLVTGELIFNTEDRPVAWVVTRYRGDRCRLSGTVILAQTETERGIIGE